MSKWYVTIDKHSSHIDDPDECVWTVSRDLGCTGWNTDSGHSGYGLTKADAEELANAANEIERLRAALQKITDDNGYTECCGGGTTGDQFNPPECCGDPVWAFDRCVKIARAALEGEQKNG